MQFHIAWIKPAAWGVVIGAVGTMIIGFSWMGWTLRSTAEQMALERANAAVVSHRNGRLGHSAREQDSELDRRQRVRGGTGEGQALASAIRTTFG